MKALDMQSWQPVRIVRTPRPNRRVLRIRGITNQRLTTKKKRG